MTPNSCQVCVFRKPLPDKAANKAGFWCLRYPPISVPFRDQHDPTGFQNISSFPAVLPTNWCGEFIRDPGVPA